MYQIKMSKFSNKLRIKQWRLGVSAGVLSLVLLTGTGFASAKDAAVQFESGELLPVAGSVWVNYDLGADGSGFEGQLKIDKYVDQGTGMISSTDKSILTVVYDIKLPKNEHKGHVSYNVGQGNFSAPNLLYQYTLADAKGNVIKTSLLKHAATEPASTSLVIGNKLSSDSGMLIDRTKELVVTKDNLKEEDSSYLQSYDNIILTHEEALSLSEHDQKLILGRVSNGARVILINPQGHDKQNFIEKQMGLQFKTTGVKNIKTDLSLLIGPEVQTDRWMTTGVSESGETFVTTAYGKGQLLAFGYDPFALKGLSVSESQTLSRTIIYQNNSQLKMSNYNYSLQYLSQRLPAEAIPSFPIMMLVFCLSVAVGIIGGVFLVKVKRMPHGMLLGVGGATVICLVIIPLYGFAVGYKGSLLNEVGYRHVDVDGTYEGVTYIGVKSNKEEALLVSDRSLGLRTAEGAYYATDSSQVTQRVSDKLDTWQIKRKNKWMMDSFVVNDSTAMPKREEQVMNLKIEGGILSGTIRNSGELPWQTPMLMVGGKYVMLPPLKVGESYALNQEMSKLPDLGSNGYVDFNKIYDGRGNKNPEDVDKAVFSSTLEYVNNNKGGFYENRLVYFTKPKASGVRLEKERYGTNTIAVNVYELGKMDNTNSEGLENLSNMRILSGHSTLVRYASNSEVQIIPTYSDNEFLAVWKPEVLNGSERWTVKYPSSTISACMFYNMKLGNWEAFKAGNKITGSALKDYRDSEGQIYIRVMGVQNYLSDADFSLMLEGGK